MYIADQFCIYVHTGTFFMFLYCLNMFCALPLVSVFKQNECLRKIRQPGSLFEEHHRRFGRGPQPAPQIGMQCSNAGCCVGRLGMGHAGTHILDRNQMSNRDRLRMLTNFRLKMVRNIKKSTVGKQIGKDPG